MRILLVCNEYPPAMHGGIGSFVFTLAHQIIENGHEVHILGFDRGIHENRISKEERVSVFRLHSPYFERTNFKLGSNDLLIQILERNYLSRQLKIYSQKTKIDLVESYDWSGPLWAHPGRPLLVRMHGAHSANALSEGRRSPRFLSYVEKRNLRMADCLVGVSRHISEVTLRAAGLGRRAYSVIYNGVDTALFRPLEIKKTENEVLFAGTVARRKGIYELFAAIPLVLKAVPDSRFTILGRLPADGKASQALKTGLLEKLPPAERERIEFAGARPYSEMPKWYNRATCAVFPSLAEAFGLTCAEAMACGTPVVMTSRASGPELVEDGVSGLLADPAEPQELADAILRYLKNADLRVSTARQAIARVQQKFSLAEVTHQNLNLYQAIIG